MTEIGDKFYREIMEKSGEWDNTDEIVEIPSIGNLRNVILLKKSFNCVIYYLTSQVKISPKKSYKEFWNFSQKGILSLKEKMGDKFVVVFLIDWDKGYLVYPSDLQKRLEELPLVKGYYKVNERDLISGKVYSFKNTDELIDLLSRYKVER
ncbi:MAG: hypothetical protein DRP72_02995 [Candidatus Omnitrophota bacterium]|nr:MAG: hypothetical protein DRP72_02995 [Candidatus Omnitrophota bacterium]